MAGPAALRQLQHVVSHEPEGDAVRFRPVSVRSTARLAPLALLVLLSACGGGGTRWNGARGYDGHGDYGYDLDASRAEASNYRGRASRNYPVPGTPDDPWGPYIKEAAARYSIPEQWIRAVMQQESGGRLVGADGSLTTSYVGAMGLMQVMPATYDTLRRQNGLGSDPYEPHDNIMAGASYIRQMYDEFGAPGFVAAYNAGPERLNAYLAGTTGLPNETVNYLARVAPRLGTQVAMTGPLAGFAGRGGGGGVAVATLGPPRGGYDPNAAYAGGGMVSGGSGGGVDVADADPSDRAFDGGGLVTTSNPTGIMTAQAAPPTPAPVAVAAVVPPQPPYQPPAYQPPSYQQAAYDPPRASTSALGARPAPAIQRASYAPPPPSPAPIRQAQGGLIPLGPLQTEPPLPARRVAFVPSTSFGDNGGTGWGIQVGAFPDPESSRAALTAARSHATKLLAGTQSVIAPVQHNGTLFRARLVGLTGDTAVLACATLTRTGTACFTVPPGS